MSHGFDACFFHHLNINPVIAAINRFHVYYTIYETILQAIILGKVDMLHIHPEIHAKPVTTVDDFVSVSFVHCCIHLMLEQYAMLLLCKSKLAYARF